MGSLFEDELLLLMGRDVRRWTLTSLRNIMMRNLEFYVAFLPMLSTSEQNDPSLTSKQ